MVHVAMAKHKIHYTLEELQEDAENLTSKYPVRTFPGNPRGTGEFSLRLLNNAARALYLREPAIAKRFYAAALDCIAAGSRAMAAGLGVEVDYEVEGKPYRGAADQPTGLAEPVKYIRALATAIGLRSSKVIDELLAVPFQAIQKAASTMDAAYLHYVTAWRAFVKGESDAAALLEEAAAQFDPSKLRVANPKSAARHSANIPVMLALFAKDERKVNEGLVGALKAHKAWWGRQLNDPEGLIAAVSAALASMALQRGMSITVTSDYVPLWLIEGRAPE